MKNQALINDAIEYMDEAFDEAQGLVYAIQYKAGVRHQTVSRGKRLLKRIEIALRDAQIWGTKDEWNKVNELSIVTANMLGRLQVLAAR